MSSYTCCGLDSGHILHRLWIRSLVGGAYRKQLINVSLTWMSLSLSLSLSLWISKHILWWGFKKKKKMKLSVIIAYIYGQVSYSSSIRGVQPFGVSGPHWKKSCLGPHIKYTNTNENWWANKKVLSKFTSLCWAIFLVIMGHMRPMGHHRLDTAVGQLKRGAEVSLEPVAIVSCL